MKALSYLLIMRLKNRLLALLKSPGGLIGTIVMLALFGFVLFSGNQGAMEAEAFRDIAELNALAFALLAIIFVLVAKNGLGKGTSLFKMPDVNLIFTSPISSRLILFYGLLQQLGTSLLMGFFLLYQYSWMHMVYGIGLPYLLTLALAYGLTVFCAQMTAMAIYIFTAGNPRRKRVALWVVVAVPAVFAVYLLVRAVQGQANLVPALVQAATGLPMSLFPVAGWARELLVGISTGQWLLALGMLAAIGAYIALMARWITTAQTDYYEDVLQATERTYTAVVAQKEGKVAEALPDNIKVGKTGLNRGWGASAFYYKHKLESRRARRFILEPMSLLMLVMTLVFAFFMREAGLIGILTFSVYLQFFTVSMGRWVRELLLPYVYMVPEPPFRKLLYCLMETFRKQAVEAVVLALGLMLIMGLTPLETLAFAISRLSFALLFTAGLLLVERLFTSVKAKWLALVLMLVVELIMAIPGIVLAVWVSIAWPAFMTFNLRALLLPAVANVPIALLAIFASRNLLRTAELNNA